MGKYDRLRQSLKERKAFDEKQQELHEKHEEISEDTVIVEKSSAVAASLSFVKATCRVIAGAVLIALAAIGIITLIYPDIRSEFIRVMGSILMEIRQMI